MRVTVENRGRSRPTLHVLPQLWARNTLVLGRAGQPDAAARHRRATARVGWPSRATRADDRRFAALDSARRLLFCENETNARRCSASSADGPFKDGFNDYLVDGDRAAVNPAPQGTKCAAGRLRVDARAGKSDRCGFALGAGRSGRLDEPASTRDPSRAGRRGRRILRALQADIADADARLVQRQALAGMLWSKQFYHFDVRALARRRSRPAATAAASARNGRNADWRHLEQRRHHLDARQVGVSLVRGVGSGVSCVALALIDPGVRQGAAPPADARMVHASERPVARLRVGVRRRQSAGSCLGRVARLSDRPRADGRCDRDFLERVFHKLLLNFTWWVNRKDADGRNIFQGGFLGLDNIGVFDRSSRCRPAASSIRPTARPGWRCTRSNLMRIALELALRKTTSTRTSP